MFEVFTWFGGKRWSLQAADKAASAPLLKDFELFTAKKSEPAKPPVKTHLHTPLNMFILMSDSVSSGFH